MRQTSWWPLAVAGVLAAVTYWLGHVASMPLPVDTSSFRHDPDYIVENFIASSYDTEGRLRYRLSADKMVHYMDDDSTELDGPKLTHHSQEAPPMHVVADRGLISSDGDNVYFLGGVRMAREPQLDKPGLEVRTEYVRFIPKSDIMRTDRPVTLSQGKSQIEASGLFADAERRYLELPGRVKAIYENRH